MQGDNATQNSFRNPLALGNNYLNPVNTNSAVKPGADSRLLEG